MARTHISLRGHLAAVRSLGRSRTVSVTRNTCTLRFLKKISSELHIELDIRDDPLMGHDECKLLAGPADTDVTAKYAVS